jgi:competence protein ComGC
MMNYLYWKARKYLGNQKGLGTIEILIILLVLVTLAFLFRDGLTKLFNQLWNRILELFGENM